MATPLETISSMTKKNNKKVKLLPLSNMTSSKSGKNGWGEVTIAIPNELVTELVIKPEEFVGGLLLVDRIEYDKEKTLIESEEK